MKYDKVILIGAGKIVLDILKDLVRMQKQWGYELLVMEYEPYLISSVEKMCQENDVTCCRFHGDKQALTAKLNELEDSVLIVSAGNTYLFPKEIVSKANIGIINFHQALLPKYRGRNASTWAIYMGEEKSGATWHWVNAGVDTGRIIWQGECPIGNDTKAYELSKDIMNKAHEGFLEIIEDILQGNSRSFPQPECEKTSKIYYSYEVPGEGRFSIKDGAKDIYRLLRSVDYGLSPVFPKMKTELYDGRTIEILSYKKIKQSVDREICTGEYIIEDNRIYLPLDVDNELVLKFREL